MIRSRKRHGVYHLCSSFRRKSSASRIIRKENLPAAAYKPGIVERNKYDVYEAKGIFKGNNLINSPIFSMVLPPPNITGKLHLGHALSCTIQDVLARRKRSLGYNVLWLPGTDHAGIATQGVVEKHLQTTQNIKRHNIGREKFNMEVWKWKEAHGNTITNQLRKLGCTLDWSREVFTMDEKHTHAVNTAFINLFQKGLIYRKKALVNWCNALKSTVSDIEVENISINGPTDIKLPDYERPVKFGLIYTFAYKIYNSNEEILVSTTMPETMLGDTAIAIHPDDVRYKHLKGMEACHPFRNTTIPIIIDHVVDMKFGTGAVKITPAHSKVDYQIAKRHNIPLLQILNEDGVIQNAGKYNGLKKYDCRSKLVNDLNNLGFMKSVVPHQMTLPICSRTGDVIEHLPKEQWFLSCKELNKLAAEVVKNKLLKIEPEKFIKNWFNWTDDDRDWCISRQLWWGHQIPAYKCSVDQDLIWVAANDENSAKTEASKLLRTLPQDITAVKDTDVLDTWFSSGIYPFASLGWPNHHNPDYKNFYPLSLMITGHDILGFWVHRMVMLGLELTDKLPFKDILLHGIICDSRGAKMSKSRGNVIDPIDVIDGISLEDLRRKANNMYKDGILNKEELNRAIAYHKSNFSNLNGIPECGVDALRFTLLSQDVSSHFVNFDVHQCHANKLFCNKIWQSVIYTQLSFAKLKSTEHEVTVNDLTFFDKWILSRLSDMVEKTNTAMDVNEFHTATKAIKTLVYHEFCDVYLEATKPGFENDNVTIGYAHAHTLSAILNTSLRSLAPFMIYLTEEIIPKIPAFETSIIHNFKDPIANIYDLPNTEDFATWKNKDLENKVNKLLSVIYLVRELKGLYGISNKLKPAVNISSTDKVLLTDLEENKKVVLNLSKSSDVRFNESRNINVINAPLDNDTEINIEMVGDDIETTILAARDKIRKRVKKMEENLKKLEATLSSSHYVNSVPEWTQILDREKLVVKMDELKRLQRLT